MGPEGGPISVDKDKALGAGTGSRLLALLLLTSGLWESHFVPLPRFIYKDRLFLGGPQELE